MFDRYRIVTLAVNLPGPLAVARLKAMGAAVQKIEPPAGDPLEHAAPKWYRELHDGIQVHRADLKDPSARNLLDSYLADAHLLITASRPSSLDRLRLGWDVLHKQFPRLSQVAIVGHAPPLAEVPGHDLLYQAEHRLLEPPALPRTCIADLAGALETVITALQLSAERASGHPARCAYVSLADAAAWFSGPLRHGLTTPGDVLGGGFAGYGIYRTADGWIAIAALEPRFRETLLRELKIDDLDWKVLQRAFLTRTADEWVAWARQRDLPISKFQE